MPMHATITIELVIPDEEGVSPDSVATACEELFTGNGEHNIQYALMDYSKNHPHRGWSVGSTATASLSYQLTP